MAGKKKATVKKSAKHTPAAKSFSGIVRENVSEELLDRLSASVMQEMQIDTKKLSKEFMEGFDAKRLADEVVSKLVYDSDFTYELADMIREDMDFSSITKVLEKGLTDQLKAGFASVKKK